MRSAQRLITLAASTFGALAIVASPATADPAGPTHYDSVVTDVDDASGGTTFEVLGGDAFLVVRAEPGTLVEVPGYSGEPYIRIEPDGTVLVNERSEARWANDERYGVATAELPAIVDNEAPPSWIEATSGGEYAWHDHRIHYMSPTLPRQVDPAAGERQEVWDWSVPFLVDGQPAEVAGTLSWVPGPAPTVPFGLVIVLGAASIAVVVRWGAALLPLLGVAIVATAAVGAAKVVGLPPGSDLEPALVVLPAIAAFIAIGGAVLAARRDGAALLVPAAGVPLLVWGLLQTGALTRPIVPGPVPVEVVRAVVALALAVGAAAVVRGVRDSLVATRVAVEEPAV